MDGNEQLAAATATAQQKADAGAIDPALVAIIIQAAVALLEWFKNRNK